MRATLRSKKIQQKKCIPYSFIYGNCTICFFSYKKNTKLRLKFFNIFFVSKLSSVLKYKFYGKRFCTQIWLFVFVFNVVQVEFSPKKSKNHKFYNYNCFFFVYYKHKFVEKTGFSSQRSKF